MAAGTPIVASDIHGYKGVVRRNEQGILVPPRDPKAIAAATLRVLGDPELAARMGANGRRRAEEFSWERVTAKVDDYYGFVIRRLAAQGQLPAHFRAAVPASPRPGSGPGPVTGTGGDAAGGDTPQEPPGDDPGADAPSDPAGERSAVDTRQVQAL